METLRRENQRLKERLVEIAERKAQSASSSCSLGSHGLADRLSDEELFDDDSMGSTSEEMLSPQGYYGYRTSSPLRAAGDSMGKEKFGKDPLALAAFSMDNIGSSNSFSWNDGHSSFNKSGGALKIDGSKSSLTLQRSTAIPPSPDSVVYLHPATGTASDPLSNVISEGGEEKVASDDDDDGDNDDTGSDACRGRSRVGGQHLSLEPVMEQIVRAVLEDKQASLNAPNCYKVLYKYALAQVEIQRKESEVKLAHLRIAKMQREAELQARLPSVASSLPSYALKDMKEDPAPEEYSDAGGNDSPESRGREVETNSTSNHNDISSLHQIPVPIVDSGERKETIETRTPRTRIESASTDAPTSTDPFAALLHELIWAIAFTFCLINNLHGPGAKRYKTLKDAASTLKKAPLQSVAPKSKDSAVLKRQNSRR